MRQIISIFFILLCSIHTIWAIKAYPYPIRITEPDGKTITILLHGDESFHYATTLDGRMIAKDNRGYYRFAGFRNGKVMLSSERAATASPISFSASRRTPPIPETEILRIRKMNSRGVPSADGIRTAARLDTPLNILVIPVEFTDIRFSVENPSDHFRQMLNTRGYTGHGATGSATDYFMDNLPDIRFCFDVTEKVTLKNSHDYYGKNDDSTPSVLIYDARIKEMVREACSAVDRNVDFTRYDNDSDGIIDFIFLYFAGYNEAENGEADFIWPQTNNLRNSGIRMDGRMLGLFGCSSELSGAEGGNMAGIGTFCHEVCHYLGLPDLYDTDYAKGGASNCLWGRLSIMDEGNYNNKGRTPPYLGAIERELLSRLKLKETDMEQLQRLSPVHVNGEAYRIPTANPGEYYLLESRAETGWDQYIGGSGMVIYHLDKSNSNVNGIQARIRWENNLINAFAEHECADLVEAYQDAVHISQVFFPGQAHITEFSSASIPSFTDWSGSPVGYRLRDIRSAYGTTTFRLEVDSTEVLADPVGCELKIYQREVFLKWDSTREGDFQWQVSWWRDRKRSQRDSLFTSLRSCRIGNLIPKEDYVLTLFHKGKHSNGDTLKMKFTTESITSPYPGIKGLRNSHHPGESIRLVVDNISEDILGIDWYINGDRIKSETYTFGTPGRYEIRAVIRYYTDNSSETITKNVKVTAHEE